MNYVITIARGFGSGGKYIGSRLAEALQIPCYDRQLITLASKESGIDESEFVEVDEKLRGSYLRQLLAKMPYSTVLQPEERDFVSDNNLFNIQAQVIRDLANSESCIIIGKCADYILRNYDNVIRIYIEAERRDCVASIMDKMGVSEERAIYLIKKTDRYRSNYYRYYTNGNKWNNPVNYDMVLNTSRVKREHCVELLKQYVKIVNQ